MFVVKNSKGIHEGTILLNITQASYSVSTSTSSAGSGTLRAYSKSAMVLTIGTLALLVSLLSRTGMTLSPELLVSLATLLLTMSSMGLWSIMSLLYPALCNIIAPSTSPTLWNSFMGAAPRRIIFSIISRRWMSV